MKNILLLLFCVPSFCFSQENHDHEHENHSHKNEFAVAIGVIPQHEYSLGFHAHYIKGIALENKLGAGISFETILDEHAHHSISLLALYRFNFGLSVAYASGLLRVSESRWLINIVN